ncbi:MULTISPECIES: TMEM175 family protein [Streptomyces]|uniref:TMEM175 family protein n=1 Tax=Streptomyces TaxID=1883 RepID=UPI0002E4161D|nr:MULTISPECIES: TMEM175 family protein [Streptomyces]MCX4487602.1 TMEM175 family protein [Streptomyces anulatus]MCX4501585.1 TMEM175 family protein [Streptomyces anulatus]MCX4522280.1 TMEM175 family protein [Streptomyces anulatus]MCX4605157.1 TMEM175 family protein [Streptomyces anulatus]WSI81328.1 TMEM175 family protein [Streptomyces anulatus]
MARVSNGSPSPARPDRLITLTDGIFAIAMTLLALEVRVAPDLDSEQFHDALRESVPQLAAYALSFLILYIFWRDQRQILLMSAKTGGLPQHLALAVLGVIALVPFPTSILAEYGDREPLAVAMYAATICLIDLLQLAMFATLKGRHGVRGVGEWRDTAADLGATIIVFGASVPIAFFAPQAAMWCWLALFPAKAVLGRRERLRGTRQEG